MEHIALQTSKPRSGEFGVYMHWPFCAAKCPYCDFNSHVSKTPIDEDAFLKSYKAEIAYWATRIDEPKPPLSSIFFGGGTPSLMSPSLVGALLDGLEQTWGFSDDIEISLEANPQSVDAANFKDLALAGVNRLSIGVQSFDDRSLKSLGRLHDAAQARLAIETAQNHFKRYSFDMIYARPGQSLRNWEAELQEAFAFGPSHLSLYQLTIEPNTPFKRLHDAGSLVLPSEELGADFYELTQALCNEAGLPAYEVSNHAVAGQEARHNILYWRYGDFLGIGPGAHGRIGIGDQRFGTLTESLPQNWLQLVEAQGHGLIEQPLIDAETQALEMVLMGMRLKEGLSLADVELRTGYTITSEVLLDLHDDGLIEAQAEGQNAQILAPSAKGMMLLNYLSGRLVEGLVQLN